MGRVTTAVRQWHVPMQIWWEWMKILFLRQEKDSEPVWAVCSVPAEPFREPVWWQDFLKSSRNTKEPVTKGATYRVSREIVQKFGEKNGSVVCKDLKGIGTGKVLRSCDGCIKDAAQILEQVMDIKTTEE